MFSKSLFSSKTFWVNLLATLVGVAGELSGLIPAKYAPMLAAAVGIANIILRLMTNGPVHVVTPTSVSQDEPGAPVVKVPAQGGFVYIGVVMLTAILALAAVCFAASLSGCASTPASPTTSSAAYDAQLTADAAVRQIPILLANKIISVDTALKIRQAAVGVYQAASAVQACTGPIANCSTAVLDTALASLASLMPKNMTPGPVANDGGGAGPPPGPHLPN